MHLECAHPGFLTTIVVLVYAKTEFFDIFILSKAWFIKLTGQGYGEC